MTARPALVFIAGVRWDDVKGTDQHLAERIGRTREVLWVDPPVSLTEIARGSNRLASAVETTEVAPGVLRVRTFAPPYPRRGASVRLTESILRRALQRVVAREGMVVDGVVNTSPHTSFDVAPGSGRRVYLGTDDLVAGADLIGHSAGGLLARQRRRLAEADVLAAVSKEILLSWGEVGRHGVVVPNGCDVSSYRDVDSARLPVDAAVGGAVAGVIGQFSSRTDLGLLEAVADTPLNLLLVGPAGSDLDAGRWRALTRRENVCWVGGKPFTELPSYLRLMDVGLVPYADTAFNRASYPLKTLEYLAAGRPVVATPLPAIVALDTPHVVTTGSPASFADAAYRLARDPRGAAAMAQRRSFAAQHDWSGRAEQLLDLVAAGAPRAGVRG